MVPIIYWFSCGKYTCRIIADSDISKFFPGQWIGKAQTLQSPSETITINLEKSAFGDYERTQNGWFLRRSHERWQAVYSQHERVLFAIESLSKDEIKVNVDNYSEKKIRLGIQYGLMTALYQKCFGLHGVTLVCGNEVIICSAPSGTGKTTLAKLLEKHCDAIIINGDFALVTPSEDGVIFEPTPFCGSSGRSLNHRFRVNRVVFLGQAKENQWRELDGREAVIRFLSNAFVPDWDKCMMQTVQENIIKCISMLKVNEFDFAPMQEAAEVFLKKVKEDTSFYSE